MEAIEKLTKYLMDRPLELRKMQGEGAKVIGYFPGDYVPVELIYASGGIPVCLIHGGDPESVEAAHQVVSRFLCPFSRAQIGHRLLGDQLYYELFNIIVAPITCQQLRRVADLWNHFTDVKVWRLGIPHEYSSPDGLKYYREGLEELKERLGKFTGIKFEPHKLKEAIELHNELRRLLKELSELRMADSPPLSTLEFIRLNHASLLADSRFMRDILRSFLKEVKGRKIEVKSPRLLLAGPCLALGDYKVLDLIEELGAMVVVEDFCEGIRYYWQEIGVDDDPLDALARFYLQERIPCAFMRWSSKRRFDFIVELVKKFRVEGIIWYQLKYCETYDIESYYLAQKFNEVGIPFLKLESEYDVSDKGPLKTRVEAFLERIRR